MKKIIYILILISIFTLNNNVLAETFKEGDYLNIYVNKKKNNKTYYLNMQPIIEEESSKYVYCLEPFEFFAKNVTYDIYEDFSNYKLSPEQLNRIHKLTNYGYGYKPKNRTELKWYAITQVLIWRTVDKDADIYFTNTLNGTRNDDLYLKEIKEIEEDINSNSPSIPNIINVDYKQNVSIGLTPDIIEIVSSDYNYTYDKKLSITNVEEDGKIKVRALNYNNGINKIFSNPENQDLIIPGYNNTDIKTIKINVIKASLILDIRKYMGSIPNEADFTNTCYGVYKNNTFIRKVCANDNLIYKLDNLNTGKYTIKQLSIGNGYQKDNTIYEVELLEDNEEKTVILNNNITTNRINIIKKYCHNNICSYEENALFNLINSKEEIIGTYKSNNKGEINIEIGYGIYKLVQIEGKDEYELVEPINIEINQYTNPYYYELYDQKKEPIIEKKEEIIPIEPPTIDEQPEEPVIIEPEEPKEEEVVEEPTEPIIEKEEIVPTTDELITDIVEEIKEEVTEEELTITSETTIDSTVLFQEIPPSTGIKTIKKYVVIIWNIFYDSFKKYKYYAIIL